VNNVGAVRPRLNGFLALTDDDWDWMLTINFSPRSEPPAPHCLTCSTGLPPRSSP
jgi:hypothetical protein